MQANPGVYRMTFIRDLTDRSLQWVDTRQRDVHAPRHKERLCKQSGLCLNAMHLIFVRNINILGIIQEHLVSFKIESLEPV